MDSSVCSSGQTAVRRDGRPVCRSCVDQTFTGRGINCYMIPLSHVFPFQLFAFSSAVIPALRDPVRRFSSSACRRNIVHPSHPLSMDAESRDKRDETFACDFCDRLFTTKGGRQRHKQAAHSKVVFKCPRAECEFSSSRKITLATHLEGVHGTTGSVVCDHPGCTFRFTSRGSITSHKRHVRSDERPFACNYTGCSFRCKTKGNLTIHQQQVHQKIRTKCCHVCEKRFFMLAHLRAHMLSQHKTNDHDMDDCADCDTCLKKSDRRSQAQWTASRKRGENEASQSQNRKVGEEGKSAAFTMQNESETTHCLNDDE